ncbi:MAG: sulfur carrier protein ThiS [Phycisphaerales bacterium JB059]
MRVTVNAEPVEIPDASTVAQLLDHLGRARELCAVEVNQTLAPKKDRDAVLLHEGDVVEIVTLVGGG